MDARKFMIIINGEIKTSEVTSCKYNPITNKWDVKYGREKAYPYNSVNVEQLTDPIVLDPNSYRISKGGKEFFDIKEIYVFKSCYRQYWHICFGNGTERDYKREELHVIESCLNGKQEKEVFRYLKQIAKLSQLRNEETGEQLLPKKFAKMGVVGKDVALAKYLNPSLVQANENAKEYIPIFPFGCNNSQYKAVKNAMENQISVIQGPPGTGKTQTILNIIANILIQGKTVQVVSNNNTATKNVYEKLSSAKYNLGFIVATLGNTSNKKEFIDAQNSEYPDFAEWHLSDEQELTLDGIKGKSAQLKKAFDAKEELAGLRQELAQLTTELEYFKQYLDNTAESHDVVITNRKLSAQKWMNLWQECQILSEQNHKVRLLHKIMNLFRYGIFDFNFYKQDISDIITTLQSMYYKAKDRELRNRISEIEKYLKGVNSRLLDELCSESMLVLKDRLAKRYGTRTNRPRFVEDDLWKHSQDVLKEYPVILSTTFSSRNSLQENVIYDYLIMDEASQVDVATGALALSSARNVVIVGDTKQLPNVVTEDDKKQAKTIFDSFHIHEGYQFTKSFLQSILEVMPSVTQTLLREHYRCHPKIINFCNQKFYKGELIIMTEDKGEEDVLGAVKTAPGNHARKRYSQRQIDVIKHEIIPKYVTDVEETGIITPYKNQVEALEKEFEDIDVATVHKFQGKEKDTIIISTVDDEISDFADDPYLINVAVSRAKKKLLLVVTGNEQTREGNITDLLSYIQYNNFEVTDSKINSVFDYLYKQYTEERKAYLQKHNKVSDYDSENLMQALIEEILQTEQFTGLDVVSFFPLKMLIKDIALLDEQERKYAMNMLTHIDFLIYNRINKKPVLAIEVDGYDFHKEGTVQAEKDVMKNHILEVYEVPLLRFKTNGSGEKEEIVRKLEWIVNGQLEE